MLKLKLSLALLALVGCSSRAEPAPPSGGDGGANGGDPNSCDDRNPCTTDVNCTPCSSLPPTQQTLGTCTCDGEIPPDCVGLSGCKHFPTTTPTGQVNDCFPVAPGFDAGLVSGVCSAGVCTPNPEQDGGK